MNYFAAWNSNKGKRLKENLYWHWMFLVLQFFSLCISEVYFSDVSLVMTSVSNASYASLSIHVNCESHAGLANHSVNTGHAIDARPV